MVVGITVAKMAGSRSESVVGFVASMNGPKVNEKQFTRYFSRCAKQPSNPCIVSLSGFMIGEWCLDLFSSNFSFTCLIWFELLDALDNYRQINDVLPNRVIIYREGLSSGQIPVFMETEPPQVRSAFSQFGENYK